MVLDLEMEEIDAIVEKHHGRQSGPEHLTEWLADQETNTSEGERHAIQQE
jgi:hypothetical protein